MLVMLKFRRSNYRSAFQRVSNHQASGNLGPAVLKELLAAGFDVTVLTRQGSDKTNIVRVTGLTYSGKGNLNARHVEVSKK
jgi:hypothetical protein